MIPHDYYITIHIQQLPIKSSKSTDYTGLNVNNPQYNGCWNEKPKLIVTVPHIFTKELYDNMIRWSNITRLHIMHVEINDNILGACQNSIVTPPILKPSSSKSNIVDGS